MKKIMYTILFFACIGHLYAQQEKKQYNIPGTFLVEVGLNFPRTKPSNFSTSVFDSRTVNLYYQFQWTPLPELAPKWSIVPGVGVSLEHYSISSKYTLNFNDLGQLILSRRNLEISKSKFITNYVELPLEFRYTANPSDPNRSFKIGFGLRGGMLLSSHTKIKYSMNGSNTKEKVRHKWNLNDFRYGAFLKVGAGNISLFGYYTFTPLFKTNLGPDKTDMSNMVFGISFNGF